MFCNHCGKELDNKNSKFCPYCGKEIGENRIQDHIMNSSYSDADRVLLDRNVSVMTIVSLVLEVCGIILFLIGVLVVLGTGGHPFWGNMVFISPIINIIGWIIGRTEYKKNKNEEYAKLANKVGKICLYCIAVIVAVAILIMVGMALQYYGG